MSVPDDESNDELGSVEFISAGKPKLLVVDDQPINVRLIYDLFKYDYDVFMATNGESGIVKCKQIRPDIILLDVVMDGMSGYDVCRILKSDPTVKNIPVVFITGQFNEQDEVKGFEVGAVDFIRKPINSVITKIRVETHLRHKIQADVLRNIATIDGLTGVANRRRFDAELNLMWRHCGREQNVLSLIVVDVDYFKLYNDHYGHAQGDLALKSVAQSLRAAVGRPQDLVARVGGEEFALLLPNTPQEKIRILLDKMFNSIRESAMVHERSPLGKLSISAGCSGMIPSVETPPKQLYEQADAALYQAKRQGKDHYRFFFEGYDECTILKSV